MVQETSGLEIKIWEPSAEATAKVYEVGVHKQVEYGEQEKCIRNNSEKHICLRGNRRERNTFEGDKGIMGQRGQKKK